MVLYFPFQRYLYQRPYLPYLLLDHISPNPPVAPQPPRARYMMPNSSQAYYSSQSVVQYPGYNTRSRGYPRAPTSSSAPASTALPLGVNWKAQLNACKTMLEPLQRMQTPPIGVAAGTVARIIGKFPEAGSPTLAHNLSHIVFYLYKISSKATDEKLNSRFEGRRPILEG